MADAPARLDRWLWFARFFKSRTLAARSIAGGSVRLNRTRVSKPGHPVKPGDVVTLLQTGKPLAVRVVSLGTRRGPACEARTLYEPLAPRPEAATGGEEKGAGQDRLACP